MLIPILFAFSCLWSWQDFRQEVEIQIYFLEKQIDHHRSEENYNPDFWYAMGKLDVYLSLRKGLEQFYLFRFDTTN